MDDKIEVDSFTDPNKGYYVIRTARGYKCTCPAYVFGKSNTCKHIQKVYEEDKQKNKQKGFSKEARQNY